MLGDDTLGDEEDRRARLYFMIQCCSPTALVPGLSYFTGLSSHRFFKDLPVVQHVDVKIHHAVATILLERQSICNALNPQMLEELTTAFSDVHQEKKVQAVVLTGSGPNFCSGLDLNILSAISDLEASDALPQWFSIWERLSELYETMLRFPKPIIAAVDGGAIGAGLGLALASDLIVCSENAFFASPEIRLGFTAGPTAGLLHFRFGSRITTHMLLTGSRLCAGEAHAHHLIDKPVSSEQIWVKASELASQCALAPREAQQATKRILNECIGEQLLTQIAAGAAQSVAACTTDAAREGIRAFLDKREPHWPS